MNNFKQIKDDELNKENEKKLVKSASIFQELYSKYNGQFKKYIVINSFADMDVSHENYTYNNLTSAINKIKSIIKKYIEDFKLSDFIKCDYPSQSKIGKLLYCWECESSDIWIFLYGVNADKKYLIRYTGTDGTEEDASFDTIEECKQWFIDTINKANNMDWETIDIEEFGIYGRSSGAIDSGSLDDYFFEIYKVN